MIIELNNLSKRYQREWILKDISFVFDENSISGVIGANGSGKSTLLKLISAAEIPSSGTINYSVNGEEVFQDQLFRQLSFSAPYMDVAEELSAEELFDFHSKFKTIQEGLSKDDFFTLVQLQEARGKHIKNFSSGMKQRLKLGFAIGFKSNLLLLDEPCSNLDSRGIEMYQQLLKDYSTNRTIIIGSNEDENELFMVNERLKLADYK